MIEAWAPRRGARVLLAGVGCGSVARFLCHHGGAASSSGGNITADMCTTTASSTHSASDQCNGSASAGGSGDIVDTPTDGDTEACSSRNSSHNAGDRSDDNAQQWRQVEVVERSKAVVAALPLWGPLPSGVTVHHAEYDCWTPNAVDVASAVAMDDDTAGSSSVCVTALDSHGAASTALFDALIVDDDEADVAAITSLRRYLAPDGLMLVRSSTHAVMELAGALADEHRGRRIVLQEQKLRGEGDEEEDDMAEYTVGVDGASSKSDGDADVQDPGSVAVFMQGGPRELSTEAWARATGMLQPSHANHLVRLRTCAHPYPHASVHFFVRFVCFYETNEYTRFNTQGRFSLLCGPVSPTFGAIVIIQLLTNTCTHVIALTAFNPTCCRVACDWLS